MTEAEVIEARRLRGTARDVFETQREMVRADLNAAGVGKRIATRLVDDGKVIAEEAADAANTHRTLVTLGALGLTGLVSARSDPGIRGQSSRPWRVRRR